MHIVTHFLAGWCVAAGARLGRRDLAIASIAGAAPDLDGIGLAVDVATRKLGMAETGFYAWHHVYAHGLPAALVVAALAAALALERRRTVLLSLVTFHLHLLGDLLGSRGLRPEDLWEVSYLQPISDALRFQWAGQWPVSSWQNTVLTAALLVLMLALAVWRGVTPLVLASPRADRAVVATLRARFLRSASSTTPA